MPNILQLTSETTANNLMEVLNKLSLLESNYDGYDENLTANIAPIHKHPNFDIWFVLVSDVTPHMGALGLSIMTFLTNDNYQGTGQSVVNTMVWEKINLTQAELDVYMPDLPE